LVMKESDHIQMSQLSSVGSRSVICHPTEVTFTPTGQVGTRFIDPVRMKG